MMSVQSRAVESFPASLSPYLKFKMALRSREVRRQYPNLLERFLECECHGKQEKVLNLVAGPVANTLQKAPSSVAGEFLLLHLAD